MPSSFDMTKFNNPVDVLGQLADEYYLRELQGQPDSEVRCLSNEACIVLTEQGEDIRIVWWISQLQVNAALRRTSYHKEYWQK